MMMDDVETLMKAPALLTEEQVTRLRVMVQDAQRIEQRVRWEDRMLRELGRAGSVVFKTADGLVAKLELPFGRVPDCYNRPIMRAELPAVDTDPGAVPEYEPVKVRRYYLKGFVGGSSTYSRVPVYEEEV